MSPTLRESLRGADLGLGVAAVIYAAWATGLVLLLRSDIGGPSDAVWVVPAMLVQTFLYSGVFITAHDAMHGNISHRWRWANDAVGTVCTLSFAGLSYRKLKSGHVRHHASPATPGRDPDFHDGEHSDLLSWFVSFGRRYVTLRQLGLMATAHTALLWLGVPWENLVLFWMAPACLSTLQLFVVGTWLPHREPVGGHSGPHRARSLDLPELWSLLACYHFGYHLEHHRAPWAPWWRLPAVRRLSPMSYGRRS